MSLDNSVKRLVGSYLNVIPIHGWAWCGNAEAPDAPAVFKIRLVRLFRWQCELRGGVGIVENPKHLFDGSWIVFSTRHEGTFDFTDQLEHYNIVLSSAEPVENEEGWPVIGPTKKSATGFAQIAAATQQTIIARTT